MTNLLKILLRTSEAWGVVISLIGELIVKAGVMSQDDFNKVLAPLLLYVIMRLISKTAKATNPPPSK